ncbi:DNA topoisomerase [Thalassospira xiamenensis]|uniref:DNA topoisomerase-1 n=1 Tax=Thalassospira xiamenensis TaxID=220697 RepID=A0A285TY21_9PROT|nr:DNA topoisomerase [Thalassospira xiamenensis]SOC30444.1 DNA topoisomerase-1 [Thalassospira xiamenensis]
MSELWIIEAPGKARTLEGILARLGLDAAVQATKGHLLQMPESLGTLGIDKDFHEYARAPQDLDLYKRIRTMARSASKVIIATDADSEGDVIAWDVAEAIADIQPHPVRVRLKGMDDESIQEALGAATEVLKADAIPGRTRAIIDRMIGATFSKPGVTVGRVATAMLGVVITEKPTVWRLNLSAPAKDGGRPWLTNVDVKPPMSLSDARKLEKTAFPALSMKSSDHAVSQPAHMGDIIVRASEELDMRPSETARALQRSYEAGKMSYPRSGSRGMSPIAARKLKKILQKSGYKFNEESVAGKPESDVHDAPYPIGNVDVTNNPARLGEDEGVRGLVARDLIKTGQKHVKETADSSKIRNHLLSEGFSPEVAQMIASLNWHREQGPRYPGQVSWSESRLEKRNQDAVLMESIMKAGLGRPSTWPNHIESFLKRNLVDDDFKLTEKGKSWLRQSPRELINPKLSVAIENACENATANLDVSGREPWEVLAQKIVTALPGNIQAPLVGSVENVQSRPRTDFRHMVEAGIDFDSLTVHNAFAYTPD